LTGKIIDLADITKSDFLNNKNSIFLMATHYEGDPPDNAAKFWGWFAKEDDWGAEYLSDHQFSCFALGDTTYEDTFARIGQ
jgi:sulfite reductase alpha subunit-like flavoprotein